MEFRRPTKHECQLLSNWYLSYLGQRIPVHRLQERLSVESEIILVAVSGECIEGFLHATWSGGPYELLGLVVLESSRRKGLGRLCMTKLLDVLADQSVEELWLEVRNDNIAARQLYLSMGARESGRRRRYYPDGTDAILMTYSIGATDSSGPGEICSGG